MDPDKTKIFESAISLLEYLDIPYGIKDSESRHVFMNEAAKSYTNTPSNFSLEGKLDSEFPVEWSELADELIEHDRATEKSMGSVSVIETHYWNNSPTLIPYLSEKTPILDKSRNCIGTIWSAKRVKLITSNIDLCTKTPSVLTTTPATSLFTNSELDVIYHVMQNRTSKEIAKLLDKSTRTIQNKINDMYQKAGINNLIQFKEFCINLGLDSFIPESSLKKGIRFLL
ncbi:helix-turn-helix transcriptional regulator [Dongshaea marina]|uniref:helix-turn-helix transcriptional regulator n=1 Tax=Dongshaea marina TaxID=2047966 RepID=UPI000D3EC633|nr:LuxR C-terminal-related transcriptional regulator [Dongshaea marina]